MARKSATMCSSSASRIDRWTAPSDRVPSSSGSSAAAAVTRVASPTRIANGCSSLRAASAPRGAAHSPSSVTTRRAGSSAADAPRASSVKACSMCRPLRTGATCGGAPASALASALVLAVAVAAVEGGGASSETSVSSPSSSSSRCSRTASPAAPAATGAAPCGRSGGGSSSSTRSERMMSCTCIGRCAHPAVSSLIVLTTIIVSERPPASSSSIASQCDGGSWTNCMIDARTRGLISSRTGRTSPLSSTPASSIPSGLVSSASVSQSAAPGTPAAPRLPCCPPLSARTIGRSCCHGVARSSSSKLRSRACMPTPPDAGRYRKLESRCCALSRTSACAAAP